MIGSFTAMMTLLAIEKLLVSLTFKHPPIDKHKIPWPISSIIITVSRPAEFGISLSLPVIPVRISELRRRLFYVNDIHVVSSSLLILIVEITLTTR